MLTQTKDVSARRQAMRERVKAASGGFPPAWKPEPEDLLEGVLVRYEHFTGNTKATPCDVAIIADTATEAEVAVFIRNAILVDCFKRLRPRPGEFVVLRFLGKSTTSRANLRTCGCWTSTGTRTRLSRSCRRSTSSPTATTMARTSRTTRPMRRRSRRFEGGAEPDGREDGGD